MGETSLGVRDRLAVGDDQPGDMGTGGLGGHLLPEHRAYRQLERVDGAGHPAAGVLVHERCERRIGAKDVSDGGGVGVEVEQVAAPADRGGEVTAVAEGQTAADVVGHRPQGDDAVAVRQAQRAAVRAVAPLLHPGHGGRGEMPEQVAGTQRSPERQPQRHRPAVVGHRPFAGRCRNGEGVVLTAGSRPGVIVTAGPRLGGALPRPGVLVMHTCSVHESDGRHARALHEERAPSSPASPSGPRCRRCPRCPRLA